MTPPTLAAVKVFTQPMLPWPSATCGCRPARRGAVLCRGRKLLDFPLNTWLGVEMRAPLGQPNSRWELTLKLADGAIREFKDLPCDPAWKEARWVGFSSLATRAVAFYLDDVGMENR